MFTAFSNRLSGFVIARRIVEWRRHTPTQDELMMLGEHEPDGLPFSKCKTRAETSTR
jgi:hypothetical protein